MTRQEFKSTYRVLPYAVRHGGGILDRIFQGKGARIYLGGEHVLIIQQPMFQETWQTLAYENILGISVTPTRRWYWYSIYWIIIAACILLSGFLLLNNSFTSGAAYYVWGLLIFPLYYLCANLYMGQSCSVNIVTAVQPYEVSALRRMKVADRVLPELQQVIRSAQIAKGIGVPPTPEPVAAPPEPEDTTAPIPGDVE